MDTNESPPQDRTEPLRVGPLTQFALKTAIVTVAIVVAMTFLLDSVFANLNTVLRQNIEIVRADVRALTNLKGKFGGRDVWNKLETELERAADPKNEIAPERKKKILANLRIVADRWRPVVVEVTDIIAGPPAPNAPVVKK